MTTSLPVDKDDAKGYERITAAYNVLRPKTAFAAFTIFTGDQP